MPSMKILLIAGGWSSEREVSLTGARGMQEALLKRGHAVTFFDLLENFDELLETARQHDFALINLHGSPGEDGLVQAMLEKADCPYQGSGPSGSFLALNKAEKGTKIWCAGVDLGAYQAVNCRLRRPNLFAGAVGMGGIYDLSRFWGAENDDLVLRCSPLLYLQENGIANKLALAKAEENSLILCAGQGAYEDDAKADTQALADVLQAQGLPAHLELWGGDVSHDWYWWGKMWSLFAPRILEK